MSIRFDFGEIKKPHKTADGMLLAEATFARDGILEYRRLDGTIRRELRLPETNQDSKVLTSFGLAPVTIEHPPELVTEYNAELYRKGISLQNVRYEGKGGFVRGEVALMDSKAIALVESGQKAELSAGYTCDVDETPGVWKGQHYDAIQKNVSINHIAITERGRAGAAVRLHTDSFNDPDVAFQIPSGNDSPRSDSDSPSTPKKRMATVRIDSVEYSDIPEVFASVVSQKLQKIDTLQPRVDSLEAEKQEWESERAQLEEDRDRQEGRADATEVCLSNAEAILSEMGYRRDGEGGYFRVDGGKKHAAMDMEEEEYDEEGDDEGDEEEMPPMKKGKSKKDGKKCDSADAEAAEQINPKEAAKALASALREADQLVPRTDSMSFSDIHFDAVETPEDVRRLVVATLRPNLKEKLDSASDAYIAGVYDDLKDQLEATEEPQRTDSAVRTDASDGLLAVISAARGSEGASKSGSALTESAQRRMNAYKQPLSMTKDR